jgi:hypothetical protein
VSRDCFGLAAGEFLPGEDADGCGSGGISEAALLKDVVDDRFIGDVEAAEGEAAAEHIGGGDRDGACEFGDHAVLRIRNEERDRESSATCAEGHYG